MATSQTLTLTFSNVRGEIKKHLSIIGKRLYTKDGKNLFSNITVSSAEDGIFDHYIYAAAQNIAGALAQFVTTFTPSTTAPAITVDSSRWSDQVAKNVTKAADSYALLFSVGEYLAMTHPELADKYYRDAQGMMNTIITTAFFKAPPTATTAGNPTSASAAVTRS